MKHNIRHRVSPIFPLLATFVPLFFASQVRGQPRENPLERARHYMELGQEAFEEGKFEMAADQFIAAFTASPFSAFLYNAGFAYERAGSYETAVDFYRQYLKADPGAQDYAQVELRIRALLTVAQTPSEPNIKITETETQAEPAPEIEMKSLISVRINPKDAKIRILDEQGAEVSQSDSTSQTVVRGIYTVEASHPDYRTMQTQVEVSPGQVYLLVLEMSQGEFLGFLQVTTDVPGAVVYLDDRDVGSVGTTPWGNVLPAGKHTVWIEKPGHVPVEKEMEINLGDRIELSLTLERVAFGILQVKTNTPKADILLNGEPVGSAPFQEQIRPGRYALLVKSEGMKDYTADIAVGRGQLTKVLVRMNAKPSHTAAWVTLGMAAGVLAGGGVAGGIALKRQRTIDSLRNQGRLSSDDPRITEGFTWGLGADLAFGVGAVLGAISIYNFLRDPLPPSEGKLFDPVDFEENPDNVVLKTEEEPGVPSAPDEVDGEPLQPTPTENEKPSAEPVAPGPTPPPEGQLQSRFTLTPILSDQTLGLGMTVTF